MTQILTTSAPAFAAIARLFEGLRKRISAAADMQTEASLSSRLQYDAGLSDLCPERVPGSSIDVTRRELDRDMLRRSF